MKIYTECWNYIKECRKQVYTAGLILFLSAVIGYFLPIFFMDAIKDFLKELLLKTLGLNTFQLIIFIFLNNLFVSFIGLFTGILFGVIPIFLSIVNGYLLGFVSKLVVQESGFLILLKLLPHGIFELPAVLISLGLGIKLGCSLFYRHKEALRIIKKSILVFLFIVLPLLLIAGIIEGLLIGIFS